MDATDVIEAFGGYKHFSEMLELQPNSVFMWQRQGIPETRVLAIWQLTKRIRAEGTAADRKRLAGITLEGLLSNQPRHPAPRKRVKQPDKGSARGPKPAKLNSLRKRVRKSQPANATTG